MRRARKPITVAPLAGVFVAVFSAACVVATVLPDAQLRRLQPVLWLLGPPASLICGSSYLWAFALGTSLNVASLVLALKGSAAWSRLLGILLTIVSWCLSGLLVYAPGA